jgi:hypothetical protein
MVVADTNYNNSYMRTLFSTALSNASEEYSVYLDSVRKEFRDAYMAKCLSVAPRLGMTADLYEYHYTLYYYDQSGNLVKTIPPKGVVLLTDTQIQDVQRYRLLTHEGCYRFSDSVRLGGSGYIQFPLAGNPTIEPFTLEAYVNPSTLTDQVLFAKLLAGSGSQGSYSTGYVLQIKNQKLVLTFKSLGPDQLPIQAVAESQDISGMLNIGLWNYIAFGRTGNANAPGMININGRPLLLTYTENTIGNNKPLSLDGQDLVIGKYPSGMPGGDPTDYFTGTIKNVRIYNRLLSLTEITQNAFSLCQLPVSTNGLVLWSAMNSATGNVVPTIVGSSGDLYNTSWQAFAGVYPQHNLPTTYQYNSLNQVVRQSSPDGGVSQFWYDYVGRLVLSQNSEQANIPANLKYSYTLYDNIGRITEVGEKIQASAAVTHALTLDKIQLNNWLAAYQSQQITHTVYDDYNSGELLTDPLHEPIYNAMTFSTSRKRVVASYTKASASGSILTASYYQYDINGNVKTLWQENNALNSVSASRNGIKQIDYDYDLVSGKVNRVSYQPGKGDQFFHKYLYDAENRLTDVYTSRDELIWQQDAFYRYYLHGPLARTELGDRKVQGLDYAYTLQGWLKGMNGTTVNAEYDMGRDNYQNPSEYNHSTVSRDVFSYDLNYFNTDFRPLGTTAPAFRNPFYNFATETAAVGKELFNGNIKSMSVSLSQFGLYHYSYRYDQLNRLMEKRSFNDGEGYLQEVNDYNESFSYDGNGNILSAVKSASESSPGGINMDILGYQYLPGSNKLDYVTDQVSASAHANDVDGQSTGNYTYDNIGNLVSDVQENITSISWTVYGKINSILKQNTVTQKETNIQYGYDPSGNRINKNVTQRDIGITGQDIIDHTYYLRDAQGT